MTRVASASSAGGSGPLEKSGAPGAAAVAAGGVVAERWPTLARALGTYDSGVAEAFSRMAYEHVEAGVIRFEHRRRLAHAAERLGIRPFDAQLLIACAVRKWALDRSYDPSPSRDAPQLSAEYQWWGRAWMRWALVAGAVVAVEGMMVWHWMSAG